MQRFVNEPDYVVDDMIAGYLSVHHRTVRQSDKNNHVIVSNQIEKNKVAIVSGGGSGHEPCFLGYVGEGGLDAVAIGEVFSSPPATAFLAAFEEADQGQGVACLIGNYAGDTMNVKMAIQMAKTKGINVKCVRANDDLASAPKGSEEKRHGIAAGPAIWKMVKNYAKTGANLDEVIEFASRINQQTRSIGIGLEPCSIPAVGHSNFTIEKDTMELGIGHHGEPGKEILPLQPAKKIATLLCDEILADLSFDRGDEMVVLLSGMGSTPLMEQYILVNTIISYLKQKDLVIVDSLVGNLVTSLEMNGVALTVVKLDEEMKKYWLN